MGSATWWPRRKPVAAIGVSPNTCFNLRKSPPRSAVVRNLRTNFSVWLRLAAHPVHPARPGFLSGFLLSKNLLSLLGFCSPWMLALGISLVLGCWFLDFFPIESV
jgi:hypothetical protein